MRKNFRLALFITAVLLVVSFVALPSSGNVVQAATKEITITITEAQITASLKSSIRGHIRNIVADIIDGGIVIKLYVDYVDVQEIHENFGVLIRDGKIVTEAGVIDFPGYGALGYADVKNLIPELAPELDHDAKVVDSIIQKKIKAKAGTKYTPISVTTGNDKVVIVVQK